MAAIGLTWSVTKLTDRVDIEGTGEHTSRTVIEFNDTRSGSDC